ncbi:XTP/dITP diphosphatase [Geoglobus acetivorans]|uniref:dITP/XTP pyrophosphatase n=1 Tax=Geoglobus acetivorans TaxID=565033 RepID=A0A0A7GIX8_GEOAI|nr:Xanthosine/inosine triphosphate pyrophosphatase [Geoglobus acetivorans]
MKVRFITSNKGKFEEMKHIGEKYGIDVEWVSMEYLEPQGSSLEFVARKSIEMIGAKPPFFIEDSGLFIEALNGFPGVYSSYVFKTIGNEGILKLMEGVENRKARFVCVIAYTDGNEMQIFTGEVEGEIAHEARGEAGFGYDPIFEVSGRTFAEMGEEKNAVSHRRRAAEKFFSWLAKSF